MKKYIYFFLWMLLYQNIHSQILFERSPLDRIWLLGGDDIKMDFNYSPPLITGDDRPFNFDFTNASICDANGELLFYTNGIRVANSDNQYLENGYRINPGEVTDSWAFTGNRIVQGAIALPHTSFTNLFNLIYIEAVRTTLEDGLVINITRRIHHALIDMDENDGQGSVLEKDFPLLVDTMDLGKLTACRHGNGRDWWIVVPYLNANDYHRFLLDNQGIHDFGIINIGEGMKWGLGQVVFSPNGTKYINYSLNQFQENYLAIYDFDRCTGLLSNPIVIQNDNWAFHAGVAVSENGRFLYESCDTVLYQIDLEAEDIAASRIRIAQYDGYYEGNNPAFLWTTFFLAQLAPNGKIYINNNTSTMHLHTIEEPNKRGFASRVEQHNVSLPTYNQRTIPNHPYYGLGPWDGSPCDTLNINNPTPEAAFEYTPDSLEQTVEFFDASHYAYEWLWDFGDGSVPQSIAAQHPVHTYAQPGIYEVCLTVSNVTGVDTYCDTLYLGVTATNNVFSSAAKVTISPNPVRNVAVVHLENVEDFTGKDVYLSLTDASGRRFFLQEVRRLHGQSEFELDFGKLPAGLYFYRILDASQLVLANGRVVKM